MIVSISNDSISKLFNNFKIFEIDNNSLDSFRFSNLITNYKSNYCIVQILSYHAHRQKLIHSFEMSNKSVR